MELAQRKLFVGGKWIEPSTGQYVHDLDPATNQPIAEVAYGGVEDAKAAVESARAAFDNPEWRGIDPSKRGRFLYQIGQMLRDRFDEFARTESLDVGKPIREAKGDIAFVYKTFEYWAGLADKIEGETIPVPGNRLNYTLRQPVGVTLHIAPWNYPLTLACRGVAPALAAGNTAVLKPAQVTPLSALLLAEVAEKVGLPPGVLNIVTGPGSTVGQALASHPDVDSITFTGSLETGRQIMAMAAKNVTPVTLELGGKNPNIVFPDADMDKATKGVLFGIYQNAGQMCWAGSRLFVHESVHADFVKKVAERAAKMKLGPGLKEDTQMGPLVSRDHEKTVLSYIELGMREGARLVVGGKKAEDAELRGGNFVLPTIFDDVRPDMRIAREEIFGPVLAAASFKTLDDLLDAANAVEYGLFAGVWTKDLKTAHTMAARLECGMV
ncbi:MAG: aldehyde dehydrogenase, partial [Euryarchaeota archaeon]|nr:aldehyde dehydrogenase [Euryarchaeota archaeon]